MEWPLPRMAGTAIDRRHWQRLLSYSFQGDDEGRSWNTRETMVVGAGLE